MLEALELFGAALLADDNIPTEATGAFTGVGLGPFKESVNAPCVELVILFPRFNDALPGMVTLFLDVHLYDTDQNRLIETMQYLTANYPIPLRQEQYLGDLFRMDELHFADARGLGVSKLTVSGGRAHHMPVQATAIIKPTTIVSSP